MVKQIFYIYAITAIIVGISVLIAFLRVKFIGPGKKCTKCKYLVRKGRPSGYEHKYKCDKHKEFDYQPTYCRDFEPREDERQEES